MRHLVSLAVVAVVAALGSIAHAEPVVLAVDGRDIYVDLGGRDGVGAGTELELWHIVTARDPRTGATLRDQFALGTLTVIKSGDGVSVAHADDQLAPRVLAGDHVRISSGKRTFVDPWEEQVAAASAPPAAAPAAPVPVTSSGPSAPTAAAVDHAALARDAWHETLGRNPADRIARWNQLLAADPQTPYRRAIVTEIASLREQIRQRDEALARARDQRPEGRDPRIVRLIAQLGTETGEGELIMTPIARAMPARSIPLAFLVRRPGAVGAAWLYARPQGAAGFTRIDLVRDGDAYMRGTIDASLVHGSHVDWYVEAASTDQGATPMPVLGTQSEPRRIDIEPIVAEAPVEAHRTHIDAHVDYVDFDGKFGKGYDQYYQAEMDFGYRFIEPVYAVRLGFGSLSGVSGPKDIIDLHNMCRDPSGAYACKQVTFSYVYTELEFKLRPNLAVLVRPIAGVLTTDDKPDAMSGERCSGEDIEMCSFSTSYGARLRFRLGSEQGTNLIIGGSISKNVGTLLEAAYHWLPTPLVPVQLTVQVTDQPVVEDYGVRLIADVGINRWGWFYPSVRASYQARDIDHAGFSGGLALNFDW